MASVNFKQTTLKREVPGSNGEEYLEIRRLTAGEERQKNSIASRLVISGDSTTVMQMNIDEMKLFEFEKAIIDYKLKDDNGNILVFSNPSNNRRVYQHFSQEICDLFDSMMDELNGTQEQKEDLVKNLENSPAES